jgi:hypothetical protein
MRGAREAALDRAFQQQSIVAPGLVALLGLGVVALDPARPRRVDDRLPAGHRPDLLVGDELDALFPTAPEGAELAVFLFLDEELHDQAEFVGLEVARLVDLGVL